jgi:uncharacterized protein (DUF1330 family)
MAKGYWIGRVDVHNPEGYQAYVRANGPVFAKYGARFLVRGGTFDAASAEGTTRSRNVVIEFESYAKALECWTSAEYAALRALRAPHATADILVIEGYDGPQPA